MKDKTKAKIEALEFCQVAIRQVQKSKSAYIKQAAVDLEVEFTERIEVLKASDREPALPFHANEQHELEASKGGR